MIMVNGDHDNENGDNETFLSPGWASPTWCQSLPRVRSSASIRYLVKTLFTWQVDSRTCQIRDNNNNEQSSTQRQEHQQKYLVISVPPSSAGGLQLTSTLSWKTSVTLQVNGGVGLSEGKVSEAMPTIIFTHDVDVDVPFVAALGVADDHLGGNA